MTGITTTTTAPNYQELLIQNQSQKEYMSILEKTNQQLSVRGNPYGIMIGFLSILVTFGAVFVAIYIYKQSRDYKEQQKETQQKYEDSLNGLLESENKRIKEESEKHELIFKDYTEKLKVYSEKLKDKEIELQTLIETYETKLTSTATENQDEIKKILSDLKKEKEKVISEISTPTVPLEITNNDRFSIYGNLNKKIIKCTKCKRGFYVDSPRFPNIDSILPSNLITNTLIFDNETYGVSKHEAICPYCQNKCYVD